MPGNALIKLKFGSLLARLVPMPVAVRVGYFLGVFLGPRLMPEKADQLRRHLIRIDPSLHQNVNSAVRRGFGSYGRYWVESFKLPHAKAKTITSNFTANNLEHLTDVYNSGVGPILVMPHLGGWEWAAAWLTTHQGFSVSAVVEKLEPEEVCEWFTKLRGGYGVQVVSLGPSALGDLVKLVRSGTIVALMADRDVAGTGVEVEFFGERTKLPVGPALLSRRTGAPLLPTAAFYDGWGYRAEVGEPIYPEWSGDFRKDLVAVTQLLADHLEEMIRSAPEQWHVLEPNWPSDLVEKNG